MPWRLPTDDEAADIIRRIDQLFADLYSILRAVVVGFFSPQIEPPEIEDEESTNSNTVPDLLAHLDHDDQSKEHAEDDERPPIR